MSECHDQTHALLSQFGTRGSHAADALILHIIGPLEHDLERCRDELHYRTKSEESICDEVARLREALAKAEEKRDTAIGYRNQYCEERNQARVRAVSAKALLAEAKSALERIAFGGNAIGLRDIARSVLAKLKQREGSNG